MKIQEALNQLKENKSRLENQIESGKFSETLVAKKQASLERVSKRIEICEKFINYRLRPDYIFSQEEKEFLTEYGVEIDFLGIINQ